MNRSTTFSVATTVAAAVGLALSIQGPVYGQGMGQGMSHGAMGNHMPSSWTPHEACYGINAVGKNDCRTAATTGPGKATKARDPKSFVDVPVGVCEKIEGGSLTAM